MVGRILCVVGLAWTLGCGESPGFSGGGSSSKDAKPKKKEVSWPEQEPESDRDGVFEGYDTGDKKVVGGGTPHQKIWLNFTGATVNRGHSVVLRNRKLKKVTVPPFQVKDLGPDYADHNRKDLIASVMEELQKRFADIKVELSATMPQPPFTTVHIGGSNFTNLDNITGIAPLDFNNFNPQNVAFVFSQELSAVKTDPVKKLVNNISHELGHSLGTRHIENERAVMNPQLFAHSDQFDQTGPYPEGDGRENSKKVLQTNLGRGKAKLKAKVPPDIFELAASRSGRTAQFSLLTTKNAAENPDHDLTEFDYTWAYEEKEVHGTAVRIKFVDQEKRELKVRVKGLEDKADEEKEVVFEVGPGVE